MILRKKSTAVIITFIFGLSIYIAYSWLTFRPPEIRITEFEARQIAIDQYIEVFKGRYNFTGIHIVQIELKEEIKTPWAQNPEWRVCVGANATMNENPYNLCLEVAIDAVSGKVLRYVALP